MHRDELHALLDRWLEPARFTDVAENGLQIEGRPEVRRVVCGVTANGALIDAALEAGADALFVHHGLVWGGGMRKLTGWLGERVRKLMGAGVSLFAYHLPLDAHPALGNNAGLADALGLSPAREPFGAYKGQLIGVMGELAAGSQPLATVLERVRVEVGEPPFVFGDLERPIRRVGLCTGGAADLLQEAVDRRLDLYVTGEATEWSKAVAEETGVAFLAAGHHNTERFGASRVAAALVAEGLDAGFVDVENPA
jgi:dinuclear metal center YbgI/SA1388 family protein